jgi:tubulin monoglycylase TTLL15
VEAAIRTIYLNKEDSILETTKKYTGGGLGRNFFEMVRFNFAIDDEGKVFIMEANMSNLSSAHFLLNQLLYRQVLYNLF